MTVAKRWTIWMSLLCLSSGAVAQSKAMLQGVVVDSAGAVLRNAHVIVHEDRSGRNVSRPIAPDITLQSDNRGQFMVALEPGFWDLCIMAEAFSPNCRKVNLSRTQILKTTVRLTVDPEVIKQIGDKF